MSELILPRRAFLAGLASILAAPAIIPAASLMPVSARMLLPPPGRDDRVGLLGWDLADPDGDTTIISVFEPADLYLDPAAPDFAGARNLLLTRQMIMRDIVKLFANSNKFLHNIGKQWDQEFGKPEAKIGTSLRIRLPVSYSVTDYMDDLVERKVECPI